AGDFSGDGVKITNLQATMTANTYIAGVEAFAPAAQLELTDDATMYGPDYLSAKSMPVLRKRPRPPLLGVGLVTVPSYKPSNSDPVPKSRFPQQWFTQPERK